MYYVIKSGSDGNAVIYNSNILVDCGVSFASLKPFLYSLQLVFITHEHGDHFNPATILRLSNERPLLRFACSEHLAQKMKFIKNLDVLKTGVWYDYGAFKISLIELYHDVPNYGIRINIGGYKIFHATDTYTLEGIEAKGYDLYAVEHNFNEDTVFETIMRLEAEGKFAHQRGAINSHLSEQKARDFIYKNAGSNYKVLRLHESKTC